MKMKLLKGFFACSLALSLSALDASSCSSDKNSDSDSLQRRQMMSSKRAQRSYQEQTQDMREQKVSGEWGIRMPAAQGCPANEGFTVSLEYLIMRSYQPNLAYAFEKKNIWEFQGPTVGDVSVQGNMVRPVRTWRPGFRVGIGWDTPYDMWNIQTDWTYYYNKSVTNKSTDPMVLSTFANLDEGFVPYWALPIVNSGAGDLVGVTTAIPMATYTQMQGVWQLNYNMVNLELGRSLYLTKAVALRPHVGLQNGWIHQKAEVAYARSLNIIPTEGLNTRPLDQLVKLDNKFWGIGFRTGIDGEWQLGYGFSVLGRVAASILSGRTNARRTQYSQTNATLDEFGGAEYLKIQNVSDRINDFAPGLDTSLGVNWGTCLSNDTMYLGLSLNWESIYWWGQFRFLQPELKTNTIAGATTFDYRGGLRESYPFSDSALNIEGLTAKLQFDF